PQQLRENPYRLASDVPGIGFLTADRIARRLGFPADSPRRARAAVLHAIAAGADEGHCCLPAGELRERTLRLLERMPEGADPAGDEDGADPGARSSPEGWTGLADGAIEELLAEEALVEDGRIYPRPLHTAERIVARRLTELASGRSSRVPAIDAERALAWFE